MGKVAFKSSVNLLKSVVTKQAGDWRKGLKELVQNSLDACVVEGVEPKIAIDVVENDDGSSTLVYSDNGCGFGNSKKGITETFAVFGDSEKAGDDRFLGKFGMGRGQSISMIYDPEADKLAGFIEIVTVSKGRKYRIHELRVDEKLEFDLEDLGKTDEKNGTRWKVHSTAGRFVKSDVKRYVSNEFVLAHPIEVCGEPVICKPDGRRSETEDAVFYVVDSGDGFELYDRGLRVKTAWLFTGFSGSIVSKRPMNLNFARNDVLEDERWTRIKKDGKELCMRWFETRSDKAHVTEMKQTGLLEQMANDPVVAERFKAVPLIPLANGTRVSLDEMRSGTVLHAPKGDRYADDLITRSGIKVLNRESEGFGVVSSILSGMGMAPLDIKSAPEAREFRTLNHVEPTADEKPAMEFLNEVFNRMGYRRDIRIGKTAMNLLGWTDGKFYVCIERRELAQHLATFKSGRKLSFLLALVPLLAHEFSHDDSDEETDIHGPVFHEHNVEKLEEMVRNVAGVSGVENEGQGV